MDCNNTWSCQTQSLLTFLQVELMLDPGCCRHEPVDETPKDDRPEFSGNYHIRIRWISENIIVIVQYAIIKNRKTPWFELFLQKWSPELLTRNYCLSAEVSISTFCRHILDQPAVPHCTGGGRRRSGWRQKRMQLHRFADAKKSQEVEGEGSP